MVQQTFSGVPDDPSPGDVISAADADKVREFILALVKDGTETTTGQTSNLLFDATDGNWEVQGHDVGVYKSWTPVPEPGGVDRSSDMETIEGGYVVVGNMCHVWAWWEVGTSPATFSGNWRVSGLPINPDTSKALVADSGLTVRNNGSVVGTFMVYDSTEDLTGVVQLGLGADELYFTLAKDGTWLDSSGAVDADGDRLFFTASYPVASA